MDHSDQRTGARDRRRATQLRETAEAAAVGGPLRARLLDLALQYDRMAADPGRDSHEARTDEGSNDGSTARLCGHRLDRPEAG